MLNDLEKLTEDSKVVDEIWTMEITSVCSLALVGCDVISFDVM